MALTDVEIRALKSRDRIYKCTDSHGLYLEVRPSGSKLWRCKYAHLGKDKRIALGRYPEVGLAEARRKRDDTKRKLYEGVDPLAERKREKLLAIYKAANTFGDLAKALSDQCGRVRGLLIARRHEPQIESKTAQSVPVFQLVT